MRPVDLLRRGSIYAESGDYTKELDCYREALNLLTDQKNSEDKTLLHSLLSRLAKAHYVIGNEEETIKIISHEMEEISAYDGYLLGLAYKKKGKFQESLSTLNRSLSLPGEKNPIHWELALNYIARQEFDHAREHLKILMSTRVSNEAKLLDAYIDLLNRNYYEAEATLKEVSQQYPLGYFMAGYAKMLQGNYQEALPFLESYLPHCPLEQVSLIEGYVGWCHLHLGNNDLAEKIFSRLSIETQELPYHLAHAKCLIDEGQKPLPKECFESLKLASLNNLHALQFYASSLVSESEQAFLYQRCLSERHYRSKSYADRCFLYGLIELSQNGNDQGHYHAASLFQHAYDAYAKQNHPNALDAILFEAQSAIDSSDETELNEAYKKLDLAFANASNHPQLPRLLFLKGLIAYIQERKEEAVNLWEQIKHEEPNALMSLGLHHYNEKSYQLAEQVFAEFAEHFPSSKDCGKALYFASLSSNEQENSSKFSQKLQEHYEDSPLAAESFFYTYTQQEYLGDNKEAFNHLLELPKKYPSSPFTIQAYYLIGIHYSKTDPANSSEAFKNAIHKYHTLSLSEDIKQHYTGIMYRAAIEGAIAQLQIGDTSHGAKKKIYYEYAVEQLEHLKTTIEKEGKPCDEPLYDEACYTLAQAYSKAGSTLESHSNLDQLIQSYSDRHITKSYFLSRCFYEKGLMAFQSKEYEKAIYYYGRSDDAGKGSILNGDQKIDLLIQKALCYQKLGDIDACLVTLSTAINEDVISSLRLKAMFLRGEVYTSQGRSDLAKRQYEALTSKKGEWATLAKERLETMRQEILSHHQG